MAEYHYPSYGHLEDISQDALDDIKEAERIRLSERRPLTGGLLVKESSCCGVPVVQSEGAHDMGNGMYVGGLIVDYCPKCHKPYHSPVIGLSQ